MVKQLFNVYLVYLWDPVLVCLYIITFLFGLEQVVARVRLMRITSFWVFTFRVNFQALKENGPHRHRTLKSPTETPASWIVSSPVVWWRLFFVAASPSFFPTLTPIWTLKQFVILNIDHIWLNIIESCPYISLYQGMMNMCQETWRNG